MDLSLEKLEKALSLRKRIHELEAQLSSLFGSTQTRASRTSSGKQRKKKRGGLTPAGRRKLSRMMKARWAAKRKSAGKK
jgi:hypothetical protein